MNNFYYQITPINNPVVTYDHCQWPIEDQSYLTDAQEILEIQYGHLFSPRMVTFQWIFSSTIVDLPIGLIHKIIKITYQHKDQIKTVNHYRIINDNRISIEYHGQPTMMTLQYEAYGHVNKNIQWAIIKKAIDLKKIN